MHSPHWLSRFAICGVLALAACSGEPSAPQIPLSAPPTAVARDGGRDFGFWSSEDSSHDQPDLDAIASYKGKPVPPDPLHDHAMIGPEGGSLRVGDFEIVVPEGAVDKATLFRIKVPVDPRAGQHAYAEFLPHMVFRRPVIIRLPRAATNAGSFAPVLWWTGDFWLPFPTYSRPDGRIETMTWHFSFYGTSYCGKGITTLGG